MQQLPLLATLSDTDLDTLYHMTRTISVPAGHVLMCEGGPPDAAYVIVEGEVEVSARRGDQDVLIAVRRDGELIGEMSLLEQAPRSATVRAVRDSRLLEITQVALETLIGCSRAARWAILAGVASRLRSTQALLEQNSRLAQLGELAADLAHEINNPAAAIRRTSGQLRTVLEERDRLAAALSALPISGEQVSALDEVRRSSAQHAREVPLGNVLTQTDREDELLEWLEQRDVQQAWEVAPVLASYSWSVGELEDLERHWADSPTGFGLLVQYAASSTLAYALVDEIARSADGISERVRAVKEYAYLDQAPVQPVDVHRSLETTLTMLRGKVPPGVTIRRDYGADVPLIDAYGSELNQVWTNLIDNALDAIGESGELVLRTSRTDRSVRVEITDTGGGISAGVLPNIFEVGFTTKPPGQGTGRGLHITRSIVQDKHRGQVAVSSRPGHTSFVVTLPIELSR